MEKEEIIRLLYEEKYDDLNAKAIEWWKSQEIIMQVIDGANEYFAHSADEMDTGFFFRTFFKNIPKGSIKDKTLAKKIMEVAYFDEIEYKISEELLNDREILVGLVINSGKLDTYLPSSLEEPAEKDSRIRQLANLVYSKGALVHERGFYEEELSMLSPDEQKVIFENYENAVNELNKKILDLDKEIEALSKEIIESEHVVESSKEEITGDATQLEHETGENKETVLQKEEQILEKESVRPIAKNVEEDVKRFEELFLSEEAIQKALQIGSRQVYIGTDIGLSSYSHITCEEEHQVGLTMPHGNNLFGLNCHVKQDENGELVYTLSLNEGVFQPTKTYWELSGVNKNGYPVSKGGLNRWEASEAAFVPKQMEVSPTKRDTCMTMTREEVLKNVRDFFSMTNEEVIKRYNIRGPHKHMLVSMIMLDAIYQHDQENDVCGIIENVLMDSDTIVYKNKAGETYEMFADLCAGGKHVILNKGKETIEVEFDVNDEYRQFCSLDNIEVSDIDIKGNSKILSVIKERLENVFGGRKHEHTLEEIEEGLSDVPREDVTRVLKDISRDVER